MSNELKIFENIEFGKVRVQVINNEAWFCLKDVCDILNINNVSQLKTRLKEDGVITNEVIDNLGRVQEATFINESNLYKVIFQSRKKEAEKFTDWVTSEVLPAIRKTGGYINGEKNMTEEELVAQAFLVVNRKLEEKTKENEVLKQNNSKLIVENQIMQPKAEYFDDLVDRSLLTSFRETAKELKVKEKTFINFLLEHKYIFRNKKGKLEPYSQYKNEGLFELKETKNDKTQWAGIQTLITPKGRETFRLLCVGL